MQYLHITTVTGPTVKVIYDAACEIAEVCLRNGCCGKESFSKLSKKDREIYKTAYFEAIVDYLVLRNDGIMREPEFLTEEEVKK